VVAAANASSLRVDNHHIIANAAISNGTINPKWSSHRKTPFWEKADTSAPYKLGLTNLRLEAVLSAPAEGTDDKGTATVFCSNSDDCGCKSQTSGSTVNITAPAANASSNVRVTNQSASLQTASEPDGNN